MPLTDHTFDLYAMLAAVTDRTRLIFVCNPNNPTSTVVDPDALTRFVEAVPPHILIAIDEAYVEYIRDGHAARQPRAGPRPQQCRCAANLFEGVRAGGLAGRLCGRAPRADHRAGQGLRAVHRDRIPQAAAIASLDAADELLARTDAVVAERARVSAALRAAGFTLPPSQANFVWLPLGPRTADFVDAGRRTRGSWSAHTAPRRSR